MEKQVVSKELYFCLEELVKLEGKDWLLRKHAIKKYSAKTGWATHSYGILNSLSLDELACLLYNGYELEETKEEKLKKVYDIAYQYRFVESNKNFILATKKILEILEIEIEGINK